MTSKVCLGRNLIASSAINSVFGKFLFLARPIETSEKSSPIKRSNSSPFMRSFKTPSPHPISRIEGFLVLYFFM